MTSTNEILVEIKSVANSILPGCRVILFGSRARQDSRFNSDYDILIVTDVYMNPSEKMPFRTKLRKMLLEYGIFSDILIQSSSEIKVKKKLKGHIVRTILLEGKEL